MSEEFKNEVPIEGDVIEAKDIPTPEEQVEINKRHRAAVVEAFKQQWLKRYGLEGIDLEEELKKIQRKESRLSRSRRDAIEQFFVLFPMLEKANENETKKEEVTTEVAEEL